MPRLVVPVLLTALVVAVGPLLVAAQDATPAAPPAADAVAGPARTDARYFLPYGRDGLKAGLTVAANDGGVCAHESLVVPGRPDAWDCLGHAGNTVYDPCFENPFAPPDRPPELACVASPFAAEVVLFAPTEPLVREKDVGPGDGVRPPDQAGATAEDLEADPWALPWVLELANGERCTLLPRIEEVLAGQHVHYGCSNGGSILGEVDRDRAVWTVAYLADGAVTTTPVDVAGACSCAERVARRGSSRTTGGLTT